MALLGMAIMVALWLEHNPLAPAKVESANFVIVESRFHECKPGQPPDIQIGDVITAWEVDNPDPAKQNSGGAIETPFDLWRVLLDQYPRQGVLHLRVVRDSTELLVPVQEVANLHLESRPPLSPEMEKTYEVLVDMESPRPLEDRIQTAESLVGQFVDPELRTWFRLKAADVFHKSTAWETSQAWYAAAVAEARTLNKPEVLAITLLRQADALRKQEAFEEAFRALDEACRLLSTHAPSSLMFAKALMLRGDMARIQGDNEKSEDDYLLADQTIERENPESLLFANNLIRLGVVSAAQGRIEQAANFFQRAYSIQTRINANTYDIANTLNNLAAIAQYSGKPDQAIDYLMQAFQLCENTDPYSLELLQKAENLSQILLQKGRFDEAEAYLKRAEEIIACKAPESLREAANLKARGDLAWYRGDLKEAERLLRNALSIRQRLTPDHLDVAGLMGDLGVVASSRGNLVEAERLYRVALESTHRTAPGSPMLITMYNNLANLVNTRGDRAIARSYFEQALDLARRNAPDGSILEATLWNNLAFLYRDQPSHYPQAEAYHRRALQVFQKLAPQSLDVAASLFNLGTLAMKENSDKAEILLLEALEIQKHLAPDSIPTSLTLQKLGGLYLDQGDLRKARQRLRESYHISSDTSPWTYQHAYTSYLLALIDRKQGFQNRALERLAQSVEIFESQITTFGGRETAQANIGQKGTCFYHEWVDLLLETGQPQQAFFVAEKSKARNLLTSIQQRDLDFGFCLTDEQIKQRNALRAEYDRVQDELKNPKDTSEPSHRQALTARLLELKNHWHAFHQHLRAQDAVTAQFISPEPWQVEKIQSSLDLDTLILTYLVMEHSSILFVIPRDGPITWHRIPRSSTQLEQAVMDFRNTLVSTTGELALRMAKKHGKDLFHDLFGPAIEEIGKAKRLVIIPDGPLFYVPFAALSLPDSNSGHPRYLIETHALAFAPSAAVFSELQQRKRPHLPKGGGSIVAFADPLTESDPPIPGNEGLLSSLLRGAKSLGHLPFARAEVEAIRSAYGDRVKVFCGSQATEKAVESVVEGARIIHFACHALLDEAFPLDSGLVLSPPASPQQGNGILQAWEIMETHRLDADLVVLSACDTARGKLFRGEGLMGLTCAFHVAGARSVIASQWQVSDIATSILMGRFYRALANGQPRCEALRSAQLSFLNGRMKGTHKQDDGYVQQMAHPFFWSSFQLMGPWD